jgi:hypothetical protein
LLHVHRPKTKEAFMKKHWSGVFVAVGIATTAMLGAQGNPSPANTPPADAGAPPSAQRSTPPPAAADAKGNSVTISGCIQDTPANATVTAAPAAPAAQAATKTFYLNHATMAADAGRTNRGAVGTSGLNATGYKLEGDTALITPHVNHQVRIVGNVQSSNASATGAANANAGSTAAMPTLKVESVTMVAAKCEEPKA